MKIVVGIILLFSSVGHARLCSNIFSIKESYQEVTISEQLRFVSKTEQELFKKDPKVFLTDLNLLKKILEVYKSISGELLKSTSTYVKTKKTLDDAINSYLEARFEPLQGETAARVREAIKVSWVTTKILGTDEDDDATAAFVQHKNRIHFEMPDKYKDSFIFWFLFFHEMEHAIQHSQLQDAFTTDGFEISNTANNQRIYAAEQGAMTAEWIFLQGVSDEEIAKAIEQVRKAKDIEGSYKELFLRTFRNSRLTLDEYLSQEHAANRYSYRFFTE